MPKVEPNWNDNIENRSFIYFFKKVISPEITGIDDDKQRISFGQPD